MAAKMNMTAPMRDLLIEHIDGPVPLHKTSQNDTLGQIRDRHLRTRMIVACLDHGWLEFDTNCSPTTSIMTEKGKHALCAVLAEWADVLTKAEGWENRLMPENSHRAKQSPAPPLPE